MDNTPIIVPNLENLEALSKAGFNLLELIKHHSRKLLWGRGYTFKGKDRKFIEEIFERVRGEQWFGQLSNILFMNGYAIIQVDKTKDGKLYPSIPFLWGSSNIAKVWETEELAITWSKVIYDQSNYYLRTTYDREKIVREFARNNGDGVFGEVIMLGESRKIADHLQLKLIEYHNLGELPVLFLPNIPHKNWMGDTLGEWYPDHQPSLDQLNSLQKQVDSILEAIEWELKYNITRIFLVTTPIQDQELKKDPNWVKDKVNRMIVVNGAMGLNTYYYRTSRKSLYYSPRKP